MKPTDYWFKRKRYGWGWVPVRWQGWAVIAVYLAIILLGATTISDVPDNTYTAEVGIYLLVVLVATVHLIIISYKKGPKPKWRWGKNSQDNPDEDW